MLKKAVLLTVLALAIPIAAVADSTITFTTQGGTLTGNSSGLTLTGSVLTFLNSQGTVSVGTNLGSLNFMTGALLTGSIAAGGTFSSAGSTFNLVGNGINGVPLGAIFTGSFVNDITLALLAGSGGHDYVLFGLISGTLPSGGSVNGLMHMDFMSTGKGWMVGSVDSTVVVPEPGTLSLFGTGLIGLAGALRRKLRLV
jgi:hypothetical protein